MTIRAIENIRHDGNDYCHGDIIKDIDDESAERLIALKVAEEIEFIQTKNKKVSDKNENEEPEGIKGEVKGKQSKKEEK